MSSASDKQYYIQRGGSVKGPYSLAKVESGLASGKLRDSDKIAANESGPWQPLGRWNRNSTTEKDDDSDDDLMGQPYDDDTGLDELARVVRNAKPVVRQQATTSKVDIARPSLRQRIEESGVEVDWDVLLGNLKKLALILGGVAAVGLTIWFGIPLASRAVQDTIQQVNEFQEAVAQVEALQPAVEVHSDNDKPGRRSNDKPQKELFEPAIRAAMDFNPGSTAESSKLPLANELRLIEPALRTDADRQVFKTLEQVKEWQMQLWLLHFLLRSQKEIFLPASQTFKTEIAKLNRMGGTHRDADEVIRLYDLINQLNAQGCIIMSGDSPPLMKPVMDEFNKRMEISSVDELVFKKHHVELQLAPGIKYYPAAELQQKLHAGMQAAIDRANQQRLGPSR